MKGHQRHYQRRGGVAAEEAVALGQDYARAGLRSADRGAEARRAAADNEHIGLPRQACVARRKRDARELLRPP